ncbi:PP2C family protein-serine/threonine phosphatase [Pyxidicoccus caerfyrddinensis]|uniref:PP2C family protein-serine/threonine phosphatase n=1 Tax=Pyxidicoccus caerfyrddinensis TaxID=2709663 RepID=UPI0013D918A5|nr:PP2C family serine/threonine-protein phosphatase [Pyxidicoccus caerfyrddinensis]
MTACTSTFDVWPCTERGRRAYHEDAVGHRPGPETAVYAVADGLGGHSGGDVAAQRAVQAVLDFVPGPGDLAGIARAAVGLAHELVLDEQRRTGTDCRTTLVLLLVRGARAVVAHVGDSRVYRLRCGVLEQLTQDHRHPESRHVLMRCLGSQRYEDNAPVPDVRELEVQPGDVYALTTDGVHDTLGTEGVRGVLREMDSVLGARWAAEELVARALAQGSTDNCTALVVRLPGGAL